MREFFIAISILGVFTSAVFADNAKISQEEVDDEIDSRTLLYEDADVAFDSIASLKSRGANDFMIAEAVIKVLRRDYNSAHGTEGAYKTHSAIFFLGKHGDSSQLTNLLYIALMTTNYYASTAARSYYNQCKDKTEFISISPLLLKRQGMDHLRATVWECLKLEAKGAESNKVASIARKHLSDDGISLFHGDRILCISQSGYAESKTRINILQNALKDEKIKKYYPVVYDTFSRELSKLKVK